MPLKYFYGTLFTHSWNVIRLILFIPSLYLYLFYCAQSNGTCCCPHWVSYCADWLWRVNYFFLRSNPNVGSKYRTMYSCSLGSSTTGTCTELSAELTSTLEKLARLYRGQETWTTDAIFYSVDLLMTCISLSIVLIANNGVIFLLKRSMWNLITWPSVVVPADSLFDDCLVDDLTLPVLHFTSQPVSYLSINVSYLSINVPFSMIILSEIFVSLVLYY